MLSSKGKVKLKTKMSIKKTESLALTLSLKKFKDLCALFSPDIAVMVRGRHGIGKSQGIYQVADKLRDDFYKDPENCIRVTEALKNERQFARKLKENNTNVWTYEMGLPVVERRLSQITEGDIVGLPVMDGVGTEFKPLTWLINCSLFPVVLFLDELNRAIPQVEQATFQLADSKTFYRHTLHAGTRIYTAINIGGSYNVQDFDPASISRYAVVDLEPTIEEFLDYLKENCNPMLFNFLKLNKAAIESKQEPEPNQKTSDRRAWVRLDKELTQSGLYDSPKDMEFLYMSAAMVGFTFGNLFWDYCKQGFDYTGEEILRGWSKIKEKLSSNQEERITSILKLCVRVEQFIKETSFNEENVKVFGPLIEKFSNDVPPEHVMNLYSAIADSRQPKNLSFLHPYIKDLIVAVHTGPKAPQPSDPKQTVLAPSMRK